MQIGQIIEQARALAKKFEENKQSPVRLPVFAFQDWLEIYAPPAGGAALTEFRNHQRRNWYLITFLERAGLSPQPVPVKSSEFITWAEVAGHNLKDGHERAHALGEYSNRPQAKPAPCRHVDSSGQTWADRTDLLATLTVFGESPEQPEVMSVALHQSDGQVLRTLNILAVENTPDQAWQKVEAFLDQHGPEKVFHDQQVRRPEFCEDCNALLVNVASPLEMGQPHPAQS